LASGGLSQLLALEIALTGRATSDRIGSSCVDPADEHRQPALGSAAHPAVGLAGVVGVYDEAHGENVWAYVTIKDGIDIPRSQDIIRCARDKVGYKAPDLVIVLDKMPMTPTGKVDRATLKKWAAKRVSAEHM
jgi:non-ribosomal peptide synthetase component E (peptide arylation enzyme)